MARVDHHHAKTLLMISVFGCSGSPHRSPNDLIWRIIMGDGYRGGYAVLVSASACMYGCIVSQSRGLAVATGYAWLFGLELLRVDQNLRLTG